MATPIDANDGKQNAWFQAPTLARAIEYLQRLSLGRQFGLLVLITAVPLLLSMLVMFSRLAAIERESIRQNLMVSAKSLAALIDNEIDTFIAIGTTLTHSVALQSGDLATFRQQAQRSLEIVPGSWLVVTDLRGQIVLSTLRPLETPLPSHIDPEIIKRAFATRKPQISDLVLGPVSQKQVAYIEIPVFKDDAPLYSISITLTPDRFLQLLQNRYSRGEVVAVIDRKHRFVARIPDHEDRVGGLASDGWRAAIAERREGWTRNRTVEGDLAMTAYVATASGWTVGLAQLEAEIDVPMRGVFWSTALLTGALTLLSLGLAALLSQHIGRGIAAFARTADDLGRGKEIVIPPAPFLEADKISLALENAAVELKRRQDQLAAANTGLEAKVIERTAELAAELKRREEMETRVRQMQKMEAIGQLSGGIAHDFNNMMAIVLGSLRLLERNLSRGERDVSKFTDGIRQGAERAVLLTQRLLAFARQQPLNPCEADANRLIAGMSDLLRRTLPENIEIETVLGGGLWRIHADPNQLENALLNLATNARDAMPEGGKLTIETVNAHLDDAYAKRHSDVTAGQYVMIAVTDTGTGMAPDVIEKAFEPFFTTKPTGQGTGLGLAQVFGFIKQSGGHVKIYNERGHGLTVKLYLPRYVGSGEIADVLPSPGDIPLSRNGELILVVEDDPAVLEMTVGMLTELKYRTVVASDGARALGLLAAKPDIQLLFTDVVMPGMNGRQLADAAKAVRPNLKVLYATGYTRNAIVHNGVVDADVELITKPFTLEALASKVYRVIGAS